MADPTSTTNSTAPESPYVGLRPYQSGDREIFFGRERDAQFLTDKIFSTRLTLLYGLSGLGKSSLLHALVIPELETNATTVVYFESWSGEEPDVALRNALVEVVDKKWVTNAGAGALTLSQLVRELCEKTEKTVVLILDQFEEFLTTHAGHLEKFRDELAALLRTDLDVRVVISMREEYIAALEPFRHSILNLFQSTYRLGPLDQSGIKTAITGPLKHLHVSYEQELVEILIEDLKERDGVARERVELPILQLVCSQLWEAAKNRKRSIKLSVALYRNQGDQNRSGVEGILGKYVISVVAKDSASRQNTANILRYLAPPSGLKTSYSVVDLANHLKLKEGTVSQELKRLEQNRILRVREFRSNERFELYHDAFIEILDPWIKEVQQNAARGKQRRRWLSIVLLVFLLGGTLALIDIAKYWKANAESNEHRLNESIARLIAFEDLASSIGKLIGEAGTGNNPQIILASIEELVNTAEKDAQEAAKQTKKDVEDEARLLGVITQPPTFDMEIDKDKVTLSGEMPDQASIDLANKAMEDSFGADNVVSHLNAVDTVTNPDWLREVINLAKTIDLENLHSPSLKANDGVLTIEGIATSEKIRRDFEERASKAVKIVAQSDFLSKVEDIENLILSNQPVTRAPLKVNNQLKIHPTLALKIDGDKVTLSGEMPDQASIDRIEIAASDNNIVLKDLIIGNAITEPDWLSKLSEVIALGKKLKDKNIYSGASMSITDRKLIIRGVALNNSVRENITVEAASLESNLEVNNQLKIPPTFAMEIDGDKVTLSGEMPDQESINKIISSFGQNREQPNLSIGTNIDTDWLSDLNTVLTLGQKLKDKNIGTDASINIADRKLTIDGIVLNNSIRKSFTEETATLESKLSMDDQLRIPPTFAMEIDGDKVTLSGEMPDQESINKIISSFGKDKAQNNLSIGDAITKPDWLSKLGDIIALGHKLKDIDIDIDKGPPTSMQVAEGILTIWGTVLNPEFREKFGTETADCLADYLKVDNQLDPAQITFATDSDEIIEPGEDILNRVAKVLIKYHDIEIQGHTDKSGAADLNLDLSQRRAESVRSYLIKIKKFPAGKLTAKGYSSDLPIVKNVTYSRRNRRIEFRIIDKPKLEKNSINFEKASQESHCQ